MTELVLCFGMWVGLCGSVFITAYPDRATCESERKAQIYAAKKLTYALCRPVQEKK